MHKTKIAIATVVLIAAAISLTLTTVAVLGAQKEVPANGQISSIGVDVYTDASATVPCTVIDWGTLSQGNVAQRTIYIKNGGNVAETLSMSTSGWNPSSANSTITLTWNKQGSLLAAGSIMPATFTLTTAENTGDLAGFSFNIVISGTA